MGMLRNFAAGALEFGLEDLKQRGEDERKTKLLEAQQAAELKRQILLEELKAQREEAKLKKDATMRIESEDAARSTLEGRSFDQFKRDLGQTDMSENQLKEVFRQQYFDRDVAPGDENSKRYDPRDSDFTKQTMTEAMKRGASSGLLNSINTELKDVRGVEREQDRMERQARIDAQREDKDRFERDLRDRQFTETQRKNDALIANMGRDRTPRNEDKLTETQKARLDILKRGVLDAEKAVGDAGNIKSRRDAAQARLDEANRKLEDFITQVESGGKPSTPKPPATENKPKQPPAISAVSGAPKGSTIGAFVPGKGWEVRQGGKVIGYAKD